MDLKYEEKTYSKKPESLGCFTVIDNTSKYFLYIPIKMAEFTTAKIPGEFELYKEIIQTCITKLEEIGRIYHHYIYLSLEVGPVKAGITQKRDGWHSDGFMSDDINFLWTDKIPTIFNNTQFDISRDHNISMDEFESQVDLSNNYTFSPNELLMVDQYSVHKPSTPTQNHHCRIFFKLSASKHKYNLKGNSHNPLFDYDWKMYDRKLVRNHPFVKERDFILDDEI